MPPTGLPLGCVVRRAGGVLNPYDSHSFFTASGPFSQASLTVRNAEKAFQKLGETLQRSTNIGGKTVIASMLAAAGEYVNDGYQEKMDETSALFRKSGLVKRLTVEKIGA